MIAASVPRSKRDQRINELLEILGLPDRARHKPGELSGGEQQRIAIAAALANDPPVILADEPTGNLDSKNAMQVQDEMLELNKELGTAVIIVTHDSRIAESMDEIYSLEDGMLTKS